MQLVQVIEMGPYIVEPRNTAATVKDGDPVARIPSANLLPIALPSLAVESPFGEDLTRCQFAALLGIP